jgi:hypothetical protein
MVIDGLRSAARCLVGVEMPFERKSHLAGWDRQIDSCVLWSTGVSALAAANEFQPSAAKACADIERTMVVELFVPVKQVSHGLQKVVLADVDIARRVIRPRRSAHECPRTQHDGHDAKSLCPDSAGTIMGRAMPNLSAHDDKLERD